MDFVALLLIGVVAATVAGLVGNQIGGRRLQTILVTGVIARMLGSTARVEVIERFYGGGSDSKMYFAFGHRYSDMFLSGELAEIFDTNWNWWGTQFVRWISALVMLFSGDNYRATMFAFSLFSYAGLVLLGRAFENSIGRRSDTFTLVLLLWPSLCFWPASIGKDTIMIFALGLATYGYIGRGGRSRFGPLLAGIGLAACIRPHIAGALASSVAFAEWAKHRSLGVKGARYMPVVSALIAIVTVYTGLTQLTGGVVDFESVQEEFEFRSSNTETGGSAIEASTGAAAIPMAFVNVLFRPFPWEAHHIFALLSALEIWSLWAVLLMYRRATMHVARNWRRSRFLTFALPTVLFITVLYGVAFANLGIIARQRVIILPFFFVFVALARSVRTSPTPAATVLSR